jgi:hypothetical protein
MAEQKISRANFIKGATLLALSGCARPRQPVQPPVETPAEEVGFTEGHGIPAEHGTPRGIAFGPDRRMVLCQGETVIVHGNESLQWRLPAPATCVYAAGGPIYAATVDSVFELSPGQREPRLVLSPFGDRSRFTSLVKLDDQLLVADAGNRIVWVIDPSWSDSRAFQGKLAEADKAGDYPGLVLPSMHLDVVPIGGRRALINNIGMHRVETHELGKGLISHWGEPGNGLEGFCGCCNPIDIAVTARGNIVTTEKGLPRVKVYSQQGEFLTLVAPVESFASKADNLDVAVNCDQVWIADAERKAFRLFLPKPETKV